MAFDVVGLGGFDAAGLEGVAFDVVGLGGFDVFRAGGVAFDVVEDVF